MTRFKTDADRMKHKQAKLIPASMWHDNQLFYEKLDESVLSIMKVNKSEDVIPALTKSHSKLNDQWKKKQAWLGIALTQPNNLSILLQTAKILEFSKKNLFSLFAILGNVAFLNDYTKQHPNAEVLEMIKDNEFYAYRKSAEHGHPEILEFIENKAIHLTQEMIISDNYAAYKHAAQNGHVDIMKKLERKASDLIVEMIQAQSYYAFRLAAHNGHIEVIRHLISKAPQLLNNMIEADNFFAYRKSLEKGHFEVGIELISNSSICFAYAEAHMHEFGQTCVSSFIERRLAALHQEALKAADSHVFDITDSEQAKICFYIVRNLMHRNDPNIQDEITFLLNIPSVKILCQTQLRGEFDSEQWSSDYESQTMLDIKAKLNQQDTTEVSKMGLFKLKPEEGVPTSLNEPNDDLTDPPPSPSPFSRTTGK